MFTFKRRILPAVLAAALGMSAVGMSAGVAMADSPATQPSNDAAMQQRMADLENKVQKLEAQNQSDQDLQMQAVDKDINAHSLGTFPGGSGYDPATGFHLGSDDGNFYMREQFLFQFRGVGQVTEHPTPTRTDNGSTDTGFEVNTLQFTASGHVFSPDLKYFINVFLVPTPLPPVNQAWVSDRIGSTDFTMKAGTFTDIYDHEDAVDDGHQLATGRSYADALIGGSAAYAGGPPITSSGGVTDEPVSTTGLDLNYHHDFMDLSMALTNGYGAVSAGGGTFDTATNALNAAGAPSNFGWEGRFNFRVMGDDTAWDQYSQFSSLGNKSPSLIVGAGYDWTEFARTNDMFNYDIDAQYNSGPLGVYGAIIGQYVNAKDGHLVAQQAPNVKYDSEGSFAFLLQGSYLINDQWEAFARYDLTELSGAPLGKATFGAASQGGHTDHTVNELDLGVNYYVWGQMAKVTLEGTWLPTGAPAAVAGLDIAQDNKHGECVAQAQFQLAL